MASTKLTFPDMDGDPQIEEPEVEPEQSLEEPAPEDVGGEDQLSAVEEEARNRGWVPQDEWVDNGGDPNEWRNASDFVDRGKLMDVISKQGKKLRSMEKAIDDFKGHYAKVEEKAREEARAALLEEKVEALEVNDHRRAVEIDEELKRVDSAEAEVPAAEKGADPFKEYFEDEWIDKNGWYNNSRAMQVTADALGRDYIVKNPSATPKDLFDYVNSEIKKEFPEKFVRGGRSPVEGGKRSGGAGKSGDTKVRNRMKNLTDDERKIGNNFVQNGLFDSLEDYVKDLVKYD